MKIETKEFNNKDVINSIFVFVFLGIPLIAFCIFLFLLKI